MPTQDISESTATYDYKLFFSQVVFSCSKVNLANENSLDLLWMSPIPAKNDKLLAQKLSLISSCCCKENQSKCQ